jgi:leucyl/phenylalanyl-tRNA--protein transferase
MGADAVPVFRLTDEIVFPPAEMADENGLLAVGGDLSPERLILAYSSGIFPWPHEGCPMLWFSPDPRMVLAPGNLRITRRLGRTLRTVPFRISMDASFREVIEGCASAPRKHETGTWITAEMVEAYTRLHELGYAHSVECTLEGRLVGGLYGVAPGAVFVGESMFALETDASKAAFVALVRQLRRWGIELIDAQIHTEHLERLGAEEWPRERYLAALCRAVRSSAPPAPWRIDDDLAGVGI